MDRNDKLTEEKKANILLLVTNFVNNLGEDDELFVTGETKSDMFTGKGTKNLYLHAEKRID